MDLFYFYLKAFILPVRSYTNKSGPETFVKCLHTFVLYYKPFDDQKQFNNKRIEQEKTQ